MAKIIADQPDRSRFIQDVTIRNFKCFEELKIEGCGQFNLILGDNNVGKTSVLEALLVTEDAEEAIDNLNALRQYKFGIHAMQRPTGLVEFFSNKKNDQAQFAVCFDYKNQNSAGLMVIEVRLVSSEALSSKQRRELKEDGSRASGAIMHTAAGAENILPLDVRKPTEDYFPFISTAAFYRNDLVGYYSQHIAPSTEKQTQLVQALRGFIQTLKGVEILVDPVFGPHLVARLEDQDHVLPFSSFGDGSIKLARILLEVSMVKDNRLMIDEIDAGIHYSRFATLWRTTLKAAIANNVQLFITTHNVECLRALRQVLETEEFAPYREECRSFTLEKLPDGRIKAYRYDYSQFSFAIDADLELRGRDL